MRYHLASENRSKMQLVSRVARKSTLGEILCFGGSKNRRENFCGKMFFFFKKIFRRSNGSIFEVKRGEASRLHRANVRSSVALECTRKSTFVVAEKIQKCFETKHIFRPRKLIVSFLQFEQCRDFRRRSTNLVDRRPDVHQSSRVFHRRRRRWTFLRDRRSRRPSFSGHGRTFWSANLGLEFCHVDEFCALCFGRRSFRSAVLRTIKIFLFFLKGTIFFKNFRGRRSRQLSNVETSRNVRSTHEPLDFMLLDE